VCTVTGTISNQVLRCRMALFLVHRFFHPDEGGAKFLWNVGSYKSYTA
jgi:hypothetical protein